MIDSLNEAVVQAEAAGCSLGEYALSQEAAEGLRTREELEAGLLRALVVMRGAVARGLPGDLRSVSGLVGGDAAKLNRMTGPLSGTLFTDVLASALAVQEVNAAMGVIVAAPTAGGAGVLPGVLLGLAGRGDIPDAALVRGLATAGLIGGVVALRASLSGAEGGCQAETGAAAAMAAGAGVEVLGGSPTVAAHAVSLAMQGTLGLVCDPLGGLVEIPVRVPERHRRRDRPRGHRDGAGGHRVPDSRRRGDRHHGGDRPVDGCSISGDRRGRPGGHPDRPAVGEGAAGPAKAFRQKHLDVT